MGRLTYSKVVLPLIGLLLLTLLGGCRTGNENRDFPTAMEVHDIVIVSSTPSLTPPRSSTRIAATLFLPPNHENGPYPLIVHSHGWGAGRVTAEDQLRLRMALANPNAPYFDRLDALVFALRDAGYAVISYDQRGFGRERNNGPYTEDGSHGMSPNFEIQDALAVIDWAHANLDLLEEPPGNPMVGMIGASYGGAFQLMAAAEDERINAIVPAVTWFDLSEALSPNTVLKKPWIVGICSVAQTTSAEFSPELALACQQGSQPSARVSRDAPLTEQFFFENNLSHYTNRPGFNMPRTDALILHSSRDLLFSQNQGDAIFRALREGGGDVRLMFHEAAHELPFQNGQPAGGHCGPIDDISTITAWLNEKLLGKPAPELPQVCLALDNESAVHLPEIPRAAEIYGVTLPPTVVNSVNNNDRHPTQDAVFIPLAQMPDNIERHVLAGIPLASLTVRPQLTLSGLLEEAGVFVGVGIRRNGELLLVNDQVKPLLASDSRTDAAPLEVELTGVAEALLPGDELGVLLYGKHNNFENPPFMAPNWDNNAVEVSGTVYLPLMIPEQIHRR